MPFFIKFEEVIVKGCKKAVFAGYQLRGKIYVHQNQNDLRLICKKLKIYAQRGVQKPTLRHI
jgi:hypothetical protein